MAKKIGLNSAVLGLKGAIRTAGSSPLEFPRSRKEPKGSGGGKIVTESPSQRLSNACPAIV
jgi:hypothetical protein